MPMPDWFKEISPARRIPVLSDPSVGEAGVHGRIPDSSAICADIAHKFPTSALCAGDPTLYGRAVWIEEFYGSDLAAAVGIGVFRPIHLARFQGKEPEVDTAKRTDTEKRAKPLDYLEGELDGSRSLYSVSQV